ncbi:hypothetical protein SELMODRAFT_430002 [Selaginella moellendorffii]|uniref:Alpha-carbonic anhydrase domain-containing protein n=1 Tax=Selaginella moellendorffii TaxID=88036 RepID=D8T806_SELML|nr:hypothetical protein SELMODRAFT_430002 [Selaginella moellendorffii]
MQSPVDIQSERLQPVCSLKLLQTRYKPANATHQSRPRHSSMYLLNPYHPCSEYHIHVHSDTVNEKHLVGILSVAVMYTIGSEYDPFIDQLSGEQDVQVVDPSLLNVGGKRFLRYVGSLTSPPCTEQPENITPYVELLNMLPGPVRPVYLGCHEKSIYALLTEKQASIFRMRANVSVVLKREYAELFSSTVF